LDESNLLLGSKIGLVVILFGLSAFFSMSETALFSLGRLSKRRLNDKTVNNLLEKPNRLLIDLLTGNTIVNILASGISASIALDLCRRSGISGEIGVGVSIAIMTITLLIFGEVVPKTLALTKPEAVAPKVAKVIGLFSLAIFPLKGILVGITSVFKTFLERLLGLKGASSSFTKGEIFSALRLGEEEGILEESDTSMIRGVFRFGEGVVKEVMIPRHLIVSSPKEASREDVLNLIQRTAYSRIPIYDGSMDNIIGVVHARDFLVYEGGDKEKGFSLEEILRPVWIVHPDKMIRELWSELQRKRCQMAVVKDRHGRLVGLVTLEDLLEEIVGEIEDEYDLLVRKR